MKSTDATPVTTQVKMDTGGHGASSFKLDTRRSEEDLKAVASRRVVLVVGGTKGLGRAIGERLAQLGANVTVVGRTFEPISGSTVKFEKADLGLMSVCDSLFTEHAVLAPLVKKADDIIFTVGIITASTRQETAEGLEADLAISALSRLVLLDRLAQLHQAGKTKSVIRTWVMGYPGQKMEPRDLDDLNAVREYKQWPQHMVTVIINEALVHAHAARFRTFGLNPGLVATGIRDNLHNRNFVGRMLEGAISLFGTSAEQYGGLTARLVLAPEVENGGLTGMSFDSKAKPLKPNPWFTPANLSALLAKCDELVSSVLVKKNPKPPLQPPAPLNRDQTVTGKF